MLARVCGLSYRKISGSNQGKNSFFLESVTFQFHARMLSSEVAQSLKSYGHFSYGHFFWPWGRDRSQSPPCWIFRVKQIHPSTASERTTRQYRPLSSQHEILTQCAFIVGPPPATLDQNQTRQFFVLSATFYDHNNSSTIISQTHTWQSIKCWHDTGP